MANYVIVGAGPAGLYTAYRLLTGGTLADGDTVQVYEWSQRPGGRIYTYELDSVATDGLYAEVGGMRFAIDSENFSTGMTPESNTTSITEGHVLVQNMIVQMDLASQVLNFQESPERLYYLRGKNLYENDITSLSVLPYNFNSEFDNFINDVPVSSPYTADNVLGGIATRFAPGLGSSNTYRSQWCEYFANGAVTANDATTAFPAGTRVQNMGYWNLLYDQLGDEGYDYAADGNGYTSNVINWNSADAMQANNDYGSGVTYCRLNGGYSTLFTTLAAQIEALCNARATAGSGIFYGMQLTSLAETEGDDTTTCTFLSSTGETSTVAADSLFLAMPRRALEMVASGCSADYLLNNPDLMYYLESSIDQPAIKAVLVFDEAWYTPSSGYCRYYPNLVAPDNASPQIEATQYIGGPTVTDLPLRMVYYFGNNTSVPPSNSGGPYVVLASYDDMNYSNFWRELETDQDYTEAPSLYQQPLHGPTSMDPTSPFAQILLKQLAEAHGADNGLPTPIAAYFQDWGQDPFGGGYHGWSPHYNICAAMYNIRAPYQNVLQDSSRNLFIIGSCYSFDQAWVEGAFCTAESVLQQYLGLQPFRDVSGNYLLICPL